MSANPFYGLAAGGPCCTRWWRIATVATVIASQALISGAFSLTRQAVQLGFSPRVTIVHTSEEARGQIYVPEVNKILMVACIALVLVFRESTKLAAAYGIAVTGTMVITTLLLHVVVRQRWGWPLWKALVADRVCCSAARHRRSCRQQRSRSCTAAGSPWRSARWSSR